jgi:DNA gyrase subunit A
MPSQGDLFERSFAREVIETPVTDEMSESFLAYSLSVITSRAIPDVRDGLKPVQRRILYSMAQLGTDRTGPTASAPASSATPWASTTRTATVRSTTHSPVWGRSSRATSASSTHTATSARSTIRPPHRYTECRLSPAAIELLAEIDEDTVEFRPTFDGQRSEPICSPPAPNLLVNGTSGIAVGMATNMAPHNLTEVYEAIKLVMTKRRPKPTIDELMAVLPGPDLPSGGIIIDDGLADAYATGRGTFRMRATAEIVNLTRRARASSSRNCRTWSGPSASSRASRNSSTTASSPASRM